MIVERGYALLEKIEKNADFSLIRACRESDGVPVLLKVLRAERATRAEIARFKHQCERIAQLASPRLVALHGVEELAGALIVVLEDFPGRDLARLLAARPQRAMPLCEALDLAAALAEGLAAVHAAGLIHRDLRPHNVLVGAGGAVKITSFGVDAEITRAHERLYAPAVIADVLPYVSPEQTGRMNRGVDHRTDFYALGVILYQTLTGQRPFEALDPMELIHAHLALAPAPPSRVDPRIPDAISGVVLKLLAKNAEDRYQSAEGLLADLERCRESLRGTGTIEPFVAGQHDRQDLFRIHQKLYGRAQDIEALTAAFERALEGSRESVLVSGYSGIGKTSLVQEILKPLARQKGYFTSGKHDQYNRDAPYSAVIQAFDGLVRQILTESEVRIQRWRSAILEALGPNAQVVCDVIPSLGHVVGAQPPVPALGPLEAQNRLNRCFLQFVSVFARSAHPLVLFLDDLQWIDPASLGLLRSLLADGSLDALFFCGAYRDNEVSPGHPFVRAIDELKHTGLVVRDIVLAPLARPHLLQMLSDSLRRDDCGPLVDAVQKKTGGNPFFVKEFVRSLHVHGVLTFSAGSGWRWDLARIDALAYTDNVVDLMVRAIGRLAATTQAALKLAAAIGNRFELDMLATVSECSPEEAYGRLDPAVSEGLVSAVRDGYRFAHDKVQEGAYAMIPEADRPAFHLRIGRLLAGKLDLSESQSLFDVVSHLNSAGDLVSDPAERLSLARMSLEAARRAEDASAFGAALRYLKLGFLRLPEDAWTSQYPLRLEYGMKTGLMLSLSGQHDDALEVLSDCLERAASRLDRTEVLRLKMSVQVLKNDLPAALAEGLAALRPFGLDLPLSPDEAMVDAQIRATMALVREKTLEALPDLPQLEDPEIRAMQDVLEALFLPCGFLSPNNRGITVAKLVENTLRHGLSKHAIFGCINFGTFLCGRGDIELGYRFGRAAIDLSERYPDRQSEAILRNMWGSYVQHWREGYPACQESLLAGMHVGLETGQYIWAFYTAVNAVMNSLLRGIPLADLLAEAQSYQPICKLDRGNAISWMVDAVVQIAHQLSVESAHPAKLKGAWVDIDEVLEEARRMGNVVSPPSAQTYMVILGVFQGAFEEAARTALSMDVEIPTVAGWLGIPACHFYAGVALTRAADVVSPEERALFLARAEVFAEKLSRWADLCPENMAHRSALLRAERARVRGDARAAWERYDEAIALAQRGGYLHDEALANELAGLSFRALGKTTIARAYLTEAHRAYGRWGATEAMRRLERAYPDLVPSEILRGATCPEAAAPATTALDLGSVLKASQAISGEIVLDRLLDALMRILVKNAGARRGCLLLARGETLFLTAEARAEGTRIEVRIPHEPETSPSDLPAPLLNYVRRSREKVILDDGTARNTIVACDDLHQQSPRSVLCLPILRQAELVGLLYMENDLIAGAFTPERLSVLEMLSAQAAISIANATLYADLLQENSERRRAEQALRDSKELLQSIVDNSTAVISLKDLEGRYLMINRRYAELFHVSEQAIVGRTDYDVFPRERADAYRAVDQEVMATGAALQAEEEALQDDGLHTYISLKYPLCNAAGQPYAICGISTDITERKQAEAERQARKTAEAESRAKTEFLANMSHELRTPLNAILGYAQILKRSPDLEDRQATGLDTIQQSGQHLLTLINDLLDLAKIEAGKIELYPEPIHLLTFLTVVADIIRVRAEQKNLHFVHEVTPHLPQAVLADKKRLRQVLLNLLGNAAKFTDRGRVRFGVQLLAQDEAGARLRFEVEDTGVGMTPEQLGKLFQPFGRVGDVQRRPGTGLGLMISRQLVHLMGSEIHVESRPDEGSRFWFDATLPVAEIAAPLRPSERVAIDYEGPRRKVLVVDDVVSNRAMLLELLSSRGFEACEAANGQEAIEQELAASPDLVLMDLVMPVMGGLEAIHCIRRDRHARGLARLPFIVISASANEEDQAESVAAGADAFLTKPIDQEGLLRIIGAQLGLTWVYARPAEEQARDSGAAALVAPPREEMEVLHALALQGNMRDIRNRAAYLTTLGESYRPFADRLDRLAQDYQSQAILTLVEQRLQGVEPNAMAGPALPRCMEGGQRP
ncbi:AAA family ATPase [Sorangium atrum]|uniref:histidine kinase n=1 Tax=Sorangium atrum TaxID=2995308 RepID=A0ABT5CH33_9BACT|nr:AAA family ATPase [Sorangium aterium]MDC0684381.1 AAA family ATPase [Sorangium aterium]